MMGSGASRAKFQIRQDRGLTCQLVPQLIGHGENGKGADLPEPFETRDLPRKIDPAVFLARPFDVISGYREDPELIA